MSKRFLWLAGVAVAAIAVTACSKKDAKTETPAETAAVEEDGAIAPVGDAKAAEANKAAGEKFLAENATREGIKSTATGLQYEVLSEGAAAGATPADGDIVDMHYVATKIDGVEFDSSRSRGAAARFPVASVAGSWTEEGVKLMKVGDRYRFYVPASLAFGETGTPGGPIGPNEALIYDVELLKVTNAESNAKIAADFLAANAQKPGVKTTESGLQYEVITEGAADGKSPADTNIVRVNYKGTLLDGAEFDSSYARNEPAEFPLGEVIAGWTEGVQLMSVGDKFRFYIPPALAYGETGTPGGPIGPNEALVFEVELLDVK